MDRVDHRVRNATSVDSLVRPLGALQRTCRDTYTYLQATLRETVVEVDSEVDSLVDPAAASRPAGHLHRPTRMELLSSASEPTRVRVLRTRTRNGYVQYRSAVLTPPADAMARTTLHETALRPRTSRAKSATSVKRSVTLPPTVLQRLRPRLLLHRHQ